MKVSCDRWLRMVVTTFDRWVVAVAVIMAARPPLRGNTQMVPAAILLRMRTTVLGTKRLMRTFVYEFLRTTMEKTIHPGTAFNTISTLLGRGLLLVPLPQSRVLRVHTSQMETTQHSNSGLTTSYHQMVAWMKRTTPLIAIASSGSLSALSTAV